MTLRYVGWTCRGRANRLKDHLEGPEKSGAGMWAAFLKAAVEHKPDEVLQHLHSRNVDEDDIAEIVSQSGVDTAAVGHVAEVFTIAALRSST